MVGKAIQRLGAAGVDQPRMDAWLLLAHLRSVDRATLLAHARDPLDENDRLSFQALVDRRAAREPLAHIIGRREFWSLDLQITADVLCPRPDSECLVDAALHEIRQSTKGHQREWNGRILDLGVGSGCLLLALLSELPAAWGVGVDISQQALSVARSNGEMLGLGKQVSWLCCDWGTSLEGRFDLIVSNPPYITDREASDLAPEIRNFEPATALFAGEDGLDAYRALRSDLERLLAPRGRICLEIGHGQAVAVEALFLQAGVRSIRRQQDLAGVDRCLVLTRD
ncbi:MAG: peptide chain release factor N(5)-glutamine methyltransferase [Pseudomonadota bacterium]